MVPVGGCDAGVPGQFHDPDGEVPEGGHDLGAVAGPGLGGVLAVDDITHLLRGSRGRTGT